MHAAWYFRRAQISSYNICIYQYNFFWLMFIYEQNNVHAHCTCYCIQSNCLLTTMLIFWWSGSDLLSMLHPNMTVCYWYMDVLLYFSYVLWKQLEVLSWCCNALLFFSIKIMESVSQLVFSAESLIFRNRLLTLSWKWLHFC